MSELEFKGGTRETTDVPEGGKELIGVVEVVSRAEEVARSLGSETPSIVVVVAVVGTMVIDSPPGSVTVELPGAAEVAVATVSSCWFSMLSIPGGTITTLSSESLAREISTSSASSLS